MYNEKSDSLEVKQGGADKIEIKQSDPDELLCATSENNELENTSKWTNKIEKTNIKLKKEKPEKKNFSKAFKCELCDKAYTWYSGLSNHNRFAHTVLKET